MRTTKRNRIREAQVLYFRRIKWTSLKKYYTGNEILGINKTIDEAKQGASWTAS